MATSRPAPPRADRCPDSVPVRGDVSTGFGPAHWMLLGVVAIWGGTFPVLKELVGGLTPTLVVAVRFTLAAVTLLGGFLMARYGTRWARWARPATLPPRVRPLHSLWVKAIVLGLFLGLAYLCQTAGLVGTSAAKAGFLTGLFVVVTPLVEWTLFSRRPSAPTWGAVALALVGLALLSVQGNAWNTLGQLSWGDGLVLGSAALYGVQLALAGQWTREEDPLQLSLIEIPTVAVVAWASIGLFAHHPLLGYGTAASPAAAVAGLGTAGWLGLVFLAVLATAVALVAQLYGQRLLPATQAAVIFALEPVFGALFSFLLLGERLSAVNLLGAGVMVASSAWVSWPTSSPSSPSSPSSFSPPPSSLSSPSSAPSLPQPQLGADAADIAGGAAGRERLGASGEGRRQGKPSRVGHSL